MDKIRLEGCRFYGYHGVFEAEHELGQIFVVDCELSVDLTAPSLTDDLENTVHYGQVFETIRRQVEEERYALIERLGGAICQDIFQHYAPVMAIKLAVKKISPPIAGHYEAVGVELYRERP